MSTSPSWLPKLERGGEPLYRQIAKALANDIRSGVLPSGARLPAQRDLAVALSVTLSTVTKAYKEVGRLNLVGGRARAGTHVVQRTASVVGWRGARPDGKNSVDLASNSVGTDRFLHELATSIPSLSANERFADLQEYPPVAGHPYHRSVVADWLHTRSVQTEAEQVVITGGAHQGLAAVLSVLAQEGVALAAEETTYAPLGPLARSLRMRVEPVPMDEHGIDPDAAERTLKKIRRAALFVTPNVSNPTTASLPLERRRALVKLARRYDLRIIEDDVFALLSERDLPCLAAMAPERVYHVSSFAKCVAPGLRMGFVRAPDRLAAAQVAAAVGLSTRMAPPLYAELACRWMADGTLERIVADHRLELERRVQIAKRTLRGFPVFAGRFGPHLWLKLPEGRREPAVVAAAAANGVLVLGSGEFALNGKAQDAIRITVTAPRSREELSEGLKVLRGILGGADRTGTPSGAA